MNDATENTFEVLRWDGRDVRLAPDELAAEAPLEIRVRRQAVSVTMRTPGNDAELAAGFLISEGIIRRASDLLAIEHCRADDTGGALNVVLAPHVRFDASRLTRHVFASSSCGLCGKATIEAIQTAFPAVDSSQLFGADMLARLPGAMRAVQATFDRTGGLHAAAAFDAEGKFVVLHEDVGRHNAVDKVIGHCLLNGPYPLERHVLLVSGRASFEIMQKALAARVPLVAAVSAPSSLAVDFALESGQTLVGFLRGRRMNVYAHARRIEFSTAFGSRPCVT
ncbi:MAG TPA: formate dehydrogenase accessory sulfurtransferase FdhD [Pirellulales bacterium]|nr:formate dehydrogenase accessory sulfurtransferase FdhD [Pirellulales bacterium]